MDSARRTAVARPLFTHHLMTGLDRLEGTELDGEPIQSTPRQYCSQPVNARVALFRYDRNVLFPLIKAIHHLRELDDPWNQS
jgi:hypothetical protein